MPHKPWKQLKRTTIYDTRYLRLHEDAVELPGGQVLNDYSVIEFNDVVSCVATDEHGNLIMLEEYRYAVNDTMLQTSAGTIVRGTEDPKAAALRELQEETGYTATDIQKVGELYDYPSKATHIIHVFRVRGAKKTTSTAHEVSEQIHVKLMRPTEVKQAVLQNKIKTSGVVGALVLAMPELFS
ncbi:MAG TPA: NUDIX hydrolase [Candidatus Saccharimonas sp.]|nr:NUDIX hydrolase [Candidatus Saccharimonas sp.]